MLWLQAELSLRAKMLQLQSHGEVMATLSLLVSCFRKNEIRYYFYGTG